MALFSKDTPPARPQARPDGAAMAPGTAFIGPAITIEGTISGSELLLVEGTVKGKINTNADVILGKQARVEATVHARNVTVEGKVTGDISADQRVELVATATVDGNIKAPKIVVAEGAKFRGNVDMGSPAPKDGAEPAAKSAK